MTRAAKIFSLFFLFLSLCLLLSAGLLWVRSLHHIDLYANLVPAADKQSILKGVGSYHGALMIGSLEDPQPCACETGYERSTMELAPKDNGRSMLQVVPAVKHGILGFGASKGELQLNLPILSLFRPPPGRKYEVIYVPYYFFMLIGVMLPGWKLYRASRRSTLPRPNPSAVSRSVQTPA